jgi:hypothetical protein
MVTVRSKPARIALLLSCIMLILMQVSGAHLHLCFDGGEPQASVHLTEDGGADLHPGASSPHTDMDVSVFGDALLKKATDTTLDLIPLLVASVVLFGAMLQTSSKALLPSRRDIPVPDSPFELRPPLRGPPA